MPDVRRRSSALGLGLTVLVAVLVSAFFVAAAKTAGTETASITFVRGPDYAQSIYLVSFDGRHVSRLLRDGHYSTCAQDFECPGDLSYSDPAWSSDGRLAASVSTEPDQGNSQTCVAVFTQKPHTRAVRCDLVSEPSWAPDGRHLALACDCLTNFLPLLTVWRIGSLQIDLPTLVRTGHFDPKPAWSPDGSRIAFARGWGASPRLYLIRPDGSGAKELLTSSANNASWSPDSRRLVFDNGHRIAVINADGTGLRYLTNSKTGDTDPAWSPDGRWIAFVRHGDLWLMDANGASQRLLVRNATQPAWKP